MIPAAFDLALLALVAVVLAACLERARDLDARTREVTSRAAAPFDPSPSEVLDDVGAAFDDCDGVR